MDSRRIPMAMPLFDANSLLVAYRLQTARLVIRCWNPTDAPLLQKAILASLDHLRPWMMWTRHEPMTLDARIQFLRRCRGQFDLGHDFAYGIFNSDETEVLGGTGLHLRRGYDVREIGYWIHVQHINRGLATEASAALTRVAFELNQVSRTEIRCVPDNVRSAAVPKKLGFTYEGIQYHDSFAKQGLEGDRLLWRLLADDYPSSPSVSLPMKAFDAIGRRLL